MQRGRVFDAGRNGRVLTPHSQPNSAFTFMKQHQDLFPPAPSKLFAHSLPTRSLDRPNMIDLVPYTLARRPSSLGPSPLSLLCLFSAHKDEGSTTSCGMA